jgi:hypothetical protein
MAKRFKYSDGDGIAVNRDDKQASYHIEFCIDDSSVLENEALQATIAFSNDNPKLLKAMDDFQAFFHPFLRTNESKEFLSEQQVGSIDVYGKRLPHPVSIPSTNGAAVVMQMQYPAVNKSPEYIDRGLQQITELLPVDFRTPDRNYVNATVEMLLRT